MPRDLRKKLGYQPANPRWWFDLGTSLCDYKRWSLVEQAGRKAVELDPRFALAWAFLAGILTFRLSRGTEGEEYARKAIKLDSNDPMCHATLGDVLRGLGRFADSETAYRAAIQASPEQSLLMGSVGSLTRIEYGAAPGRGTSPSPGYRP